MDRRLLWLTLIITGLGLAGLLYVNRPRHHTSQHQGPPPAGAPVWKVKVVKTYPHDTSAFTQGLLYHDGFLYESTGREGHSQLRKLDLESGKVLQRRKLADEFFAEGLALFKDRFYQLTWTSGTAFVYDLDFEPQNQLLYTTQGWGLTPLGDYLVLSDGSSNLSFYEPEKFFRIKTVPVACQGQAVAALNELETVEGEIWANVWMESFIARIDPESGQVVGWIDCRGLLSEREANRADVLNGIAYDPATRRIWLTGKLWPHLFEVELVGPSPSDSPESGSPTPAR